MQTVREIPTARKPCKSFYAFLYDTHGVLTKLDGELLFLSDANELTVIEPAHCLYLTPLGELGVADTQQILDRMHGGYAAVACRRKMEV